MTYARTVILVAPLCALLAACGPKQPSGQVVATVDGVEITRNELSTEPAIAALASNGDIDAALPQVLGGVIDRKVAVEQAKALKLDQTPDFIAEQRQMTETLLSQKLLERWSGEAPAPSPSAIAAFISAHPQVFDGHKLFTLDQLQTTAANVDFDALKPLTSIADVAGYFDRIGRKYSIGQNQVDSSDLPTALYTRLNQLAPGAAVALKEGQLLQVIAVRQVQAAPVSGAAQSAIAINILRRQAAQKRLTDARKATPIVYAAGFGPKP